VTFVKFRGNLNCRQWPEFRPMPWRSIGRTLIMKNNRVILNKQVFNYFYLYTALIKFCMYAVRNLQVLISARLTKFSELLWNNSVLSTYFYAKMPRMKTRSTVNRKLPCLSVE